MPKRRVRKHLIDVEGLNVEVSFKSMKTIRLKVCPPNGMVKVSAPYHIAINDIASLVVNKRPWIDDQQVRIKAASGHQALSFVTGEQHRVFGKNYVLAVKEESGKNRVECDHMSSTLTMFTKEDSVQGRSRLMDAWYKSELQRKIPGFIKRWEPVVGKSIREWRLRKMKTRWGSCNILKRRI